MHARLFGVTHFQQKLDAIPLFLICIGFSLLLSGPLVHVANTIEVEAEGPQSTSCSYQTRGGLNLGNAWMYVLAICMLIPS